MNPFRLIKMVLAAGVAAAVYAFGIEPRWLQVTHTVVPIPSLPEALRGLRVAVLSDFHVGGRSAARLARRACDMAMREQPDLVAVTGDLVAPGAPYAPIVEALRRLEAPLGVYAVPGNYDHMDDSHSFRRAMRACPHVVDLTNESRVLHVGSARLAVTGLDDLGQGGHRVNDAVAVAPAPDALIALAHRPQHAAVLQQRFGRVDLVLSGHTHGGQVRLPFAGALVNPWRSEDAGLQGLQRIAGTPVYVSRGVGTSHLPVRFFCRPEVAVLELEAV